MTKPEGDDDTRMPLASKDVVEERLSSLRQLFPEVFVDGKVDVERLRDSLGEAVEEGPERYGLSWVGKSEAIQAVKIPSIGTLVPQPDESQEFNSSENVFVEGDNLEVLKLLQRAYYGKFKAVYADPPYNTGKNEFLYPDDFRDALREYLRYSGQVTDEGDRVTTSTDANGRVHSRWLTLMYPRFFLARNLLSRDGVIFVSIDQTELSNLIQMFDEIFGYENRVGVISWKNVTDNNPTLINNDNEFIVCYAKDRTALPQAWKSQQSEAKDLLHAEYLRLREEHDDLGTVEAGIRQFIKDNGDLVGSLSRYKFVDEHGVYTGSESVHNPRAGGYDFEVLHPTTGRPMRKPANGYRFPEATYRQMEASGQILFGEDENRIVKIKKYLLDYEDSLRSVIHLEGRLGSYDLKRVFKTQSTIFSNPKPVELLLSLISYVTDKDSLVLDFFAGSGTTAEAVMRLNHRDGGSRKWLLVQLPEPLPDGSPAREFSCETLADLARARLRRVTEELSAAESPPAPSTLGFRSFSLSASNFKIWDASETPTSEKGLGEQLQLYADHVLPDRGEQDILYEIVLKSGIQLSQPIEQLDIEGATVYSVEDGKLLICLASPISREVLRAMIDREPEQVRCLDKAFEGNDQLKANTVLEMRSHDIKFQTV